MTTQLVHINSTLLFKYTGNKVLVLKLYENKPVFLFWLESTVLILLLFFLIKEILPFYVKNE